MRNSLCRYRISIWWGSLLYLKVGIMCRRCLWVIREFRWVLIGIKIRRRKGNLIVIFRILFWRVWLILRISCSSCSWGGSRIISLRISIRVGNSSWRISRKRWLRKGRRVLISWFWGLIIWVWIRSSIYRIIMKSWRRLRNNKGESYRIRINKLILIRHLNQIEKSSITFLC